MAVDPRRALRRRPAPLVRWLLHAPVLLFRLRLGSLFGHRLLLLVHRGRRSGRIFRTALEVVSYDPRSREAVVITPWHAEWLKNIETSPAIEIWLGGSRFRPHQRFLTPEEVASVLDAYARKGRIEAAGIGRLLGWKAQISASDRQRIASQTFGVGFRPQS